MIELVLSLPNSMILVVVECSSEFISESVKSNTGVINEFNIHRHISENLTYDPRPEINPFVNASWFFIEKLLIKQNTLDKF